MKRKIIAMFMTAVFAAFSMVGCGGNVSEGNSDVDSAQETSEAETDDSQTPTSEEKENEQTPGELVEILWQYPAYGEVPTGFYDMEDALNEMMEKDIGVHVTFVPTSLDKSQQDAILAVSGGEQLDVCLSAFTGLGNLVDKGLIMPLDELLEKTGKGAVLAEHNADPYTKSVYDGKVYGIPSGGANYSVYSYIMKKRYADKYNVVPDDDRIYTLDEMEEIFDKIKAEEGDGFLCFVPWNNTYEPLNYCLCEYDKFGGDMSYGVLMLNRGFDQTEIVDIFETEEYADFCDRMYRWAQKGFISADAAVTSDSPDEIVNRDYCLGTFGYGASSLDVLENSWDDEVVQFKILDGYTPNTISTINWSIPVTSANPEKALEAICYIYENKEAAWLVQFGIEGENWERIEEDGDNIAAQYTSEDLYSLEYFNPYGLWGNRLEWPAFDTAIDKNEKIKAYQEKIYEVGRVTTSAGYVFMPEKVSAEVAAVQTVIAQYAISLNCGALDPAEALPEFISGLKAAGIDEIIAENQRQFDEWLAAK